MSSNLPSAPLAAPGAPGVPPSAARRSGGPPRRSRWPVVLAATYGIATLLVLGAWALVGDPWWLQPLNLTTFWWPLPAFVLAVPALLARRWRALAWLGVPILAWTWIYGTAFLPPADVARAAPADLRVVSYNTYVATPDASHVVDLVAETDPDIVLLVEVFPSRQAELEEAFATTLPHTTTVQSEGVGGVMVASRHPIVEVDRVPVVDGARSSVRVVLDVDGVAVQVVPVHLRSPCVACGDSVADRLSLEGRSREAEMAAVLEVLDPELPTIVGGDFNSTERSLPYRELVGAGFDDPQRAAGRGPGFTWPVGSDVLPGPVVRIDWLMSRGLDPVAAWVAPSGPSDHHPVVATFRFEESS
jgi:vancomycin resistance protein VanJ